MNKLVDMWIERGYQIINDEAKTHNSQIYIMAKEGDVVFIQDFGKDGASAYCSHGGSAHCKSIEQIAELQEEIIAIKEREAYWKKKAEEQHDKLHRRNLQIADLKKQVKDFGIGHLSMNDLIANATTLLKRSGYIVTKQ